MNMTKINFLEGKESYKHQQHLVFAETFRYIKFLEGVETYIHEKLICFSRKI